MDNTVGSTNVDFCNLELDKNTAYILGLWSADGYHRTSSIGLSNTDEDLIEKFAGFLSGLFPKERIKERLYKADGKFRKKNAYHLYVNSRPLLRKFRDLRFKVAEVIEGSLISPYLAGRFDGDGSISKDFLRDCRIVYGNVEEANKDVGLLESQGFQRIKVYHYRKARTFCLYFSRFETKRFLESIYPYSLRLQKSAFVPRRDLAVNSQSLDLYNLS